MKVRSLLSKKGREVYSCTTEDAMCSVIEKLNEKRIGALAVLDPTGRLAGIISERDVLRVVRETEGKMCKKAAKEVMTKADKLITCSKDDMLDTIMAMMNENHIRHVPVVENDEIIGMLSMRDLVRELLENALTENQQLKQYVFQGY
jgi:CBS domain-containing protein